MSTNGALTILAAFNNTNGATPRGTLILAGDGNFYGTTSQGGYGGGVIYRLLLPPDFAASPSSELVYAGSNATLSATPFGTAPFTYQWLSNGVVIAGATNNTLNFSNVGLSATANYQVVVSNSLGIVTSSVASLTVGLHPFINSISNGVGSVAFSFTSTPRFTNRLWATTNLSTPLAQWAAIATNVADTNGASRFTDTNVTGISNKFYILSVP